MPDKFFVLTGIFYPAILVSMFVRKKTSPRSASIAIQIVENRREGSKISQKVLRHVASA